MGKILLDLIRLLRSGRHSGIQAYVGYRIQLAEEEAKETLARYLIRASFAQQKRVTFLLEVTKLIYESRDHMKQRSLTLHRNACAW